ncbi:hypothetical protein ACTMU2_06325 [Cupriavidus basilensis]
MRRGALDAGALQRGPGIKLGDLRGSSACGSVEREAPAAVRLGKQQYSYRGGDDHREKKTKQVRLACCAATVPALPAHAAAPIDYPGPPPIRLVIGFSCRGWGRQHRSVCMAMHWSRELGAAGDRRQQTGRRHHHRRGVRVEGAPADGYTLYIVPRPA